MRPNFAAIALSAALLAAPPAMAAGKASSGEDKSYLAVAPIAASVALPGGRRGILTAEVGLDAPDPELRARAAASLPRLRAGWFAAFSTYAASLRPGAPPDADKLAAMLQAEADRALGCKGAKVLLGTVMTN